MAIRFENVGKSFDGMPVLSEFSVEFPDRGLVAITGPSGMGKTTLLRIIAGFERPDTGFVTGVPDCISMQFEDDRLFPWMDAIANVVLVGCEEGHARELFDELGLAGREHARIGDLSGGQRRRVALARALAYPAPLLILDEPTARLDAESSNLVLDAIERHRSDCLIIVATHDSQVVDRCDFSIAVKSQA